MTMKRSRRGKAVASAATTTEASSYTFLPTTSTASSSSPSPVPGVDNELAFHLIHAIKSRRKWLSSLSKRHVNTTSSSNNSNETNDAEHAANDTTTTFLNALKNHVSTPQRQYSRTTTTSNNTISRGGTNQSQSNAPSKCLHFLLEIISDPNNSIHLRRSALYMTSQILLKSSNARNYFAKDTSSPLMNFIGMVERLGGEMMMTTTTADAAGSTTATEGGNQSQTEVESLQLEAVELIHTLAHQFGIHYPQYTVASRLLGDISLHFSPPPPPASSATTSTSTTTMQNNSRGRATTRMRMLRTLRDEALTSLGIDACCQYERMMGRADSYFRILMPRFGGFNTSNAGSDAVSAKVDEECELEVVGDEMTSEEKKIGVVGSARIQIESGNGADVGEVQEGDDDDDDISVDWEDGDIDASEEVIDDSHRGNIVSNNDHSVLADHQNAVANTLDVMTRSGALLDGQLVVQIGSGGTSSIRTAQSTHPGGESSRDSANSTTEHDAAEDPTTVARRRLRNLVRKIASRHLPRLNRWIHALSHADMMEERVVMDPATAVLPGTRQIVGPVSLVLLSQEKRAMRGKMLQRMMQIREDLVGVWRSSESLGITPDMKKGALVRVVEGSNDVSNDASTVARTNEIPPIIPSRSISMALPNSIRKRKVSKTSRFHVIYRNSKS